jgi:hypothetical protein
MHLFVTLLVFGLLYQIRAQGKINVLHKQDKNISKISFEMDKS